MKRLCTLLLAAILCFSISGTTLAAEITDVPEDAAYSDAVRWTVEQGIISPGADGTFRPSATCTRSEVVAMLWRIAGQPAPTLEVSPFRDVSPDTPNYYATLWAAEEGITVGCGADVFAPDDLCTDAQVLTFLWRADGMPSVPEASALAGANDGTYYTHAVAWADHLGLLDDAFDPNAPVTRAGIATCLHLKSMPRMTEDTPLAGAGQLVISRQPQSMEPSGGMVTFKVEASGGKAPYTYNWESKTGSGAWFRVYDTTSNTLNKFPAASMISSGLYFRCVVSDAAGSKVTSDEVKVLAAGESFSGPSGGSQSGSSQSGSSTPDSAPLTIETHPADVQAAAGNAATFKVAVSGGKAPYTYKWESKVGSGGWSRVYDSISNTLTKYPTQSMITSGLYFRCVISDAAGKSVVSNQAKILTGGELAVTQQPKDTPLGSSGCAIFKVTATGGKAPYSYKWESKTGSGNWKWDTDSISNILIKYPTQDMVTADQYYRCVITDADGKQVITDPAKILNGDQTGNGTAPGTQSGTTVVPVIPVNPVNPTDPSVGQGLHVTRHPVDVVVQKNQTAVFNAEVTGGKPPYSYNWQYKVGDSRWEDSFDSFANVVKTEVHAAWAEAGMYIRCKIMDKDANVVYTHSAKAIPEWYADVDNTTPAGFPLTLIEQPEDKRGANGDEMIFKVDVIGGYEPYSFRWQSCTDTTSWEQDLTCDGPVLTVYPTAAMADAGLRYRCIVTDDHGTELISREAAVSGAAKGELQIVTQPRNVTTEYVSSGLDVLSVEVAGGTPPYHYQWQSTSLYNTDGSFHDMSQENFNMYDYSGFNGPDLTVPIIKEERYINRRFRCVITDAAGNSVTSRVAKYESGYDRFMILEHPYDVQVDRNAPEQEVTFTVRPTGGAGAYRYYWEYTHDGLTGYEAPTEKDTWATGWFEDTLVTTSRPPYSNMRFRCFVEDFIGYGYEMSEPAQLITGR